MRPEGQSVPERRDQDDNPFADRRSSPPTDRVIDILELFARHPGSAFVTSEIANRLAMPRTTCHQILSVLAERGWLSRNPHDRRFVLGTSALELRFAAEHPTLLVNRAVHELRSVHDELGVALALTARNGDELITIAAIAEPGQLDQGSAIGSRVPFAPPFGAVLAAWYDADATNEWFDRAPQLETKTVRRLRENLGTIRRNGFGVSGLATAPTMWLSLALEELATGSSDQLRSTLGTLLSELALASSAPSLEARTIMAPVFDIDAHPAIAVTLFRAADGPPTELCIEKLVHATRLASLKLPADRG